ncbi:MAG: FAD-dependent oxidoreductase [Sulfurovum sp.]|nr:FAD-dependent oxidoreductase [Sulfurovum sp.]MCB4748619.1 FAD-dependent oxidoreductase [Sulfurovum sp.]MCB4761694.1 FAD-dependent oxidoreductase [Sulfurovum sp.]MCB4763281.1 FAD-dependent oxidoreductase [Sulfurovum sp.]MCB4774124.1 FAD-dependent oxidoreductase [Sulfurovum sp.]
MNINKLFDTAIIGGGVAGSSLLFTLARYTDIKNIILFEKYDELAQLNSNPKANSQTLHVGDIETNYTFDKAIKVKRDASLISNYIHHCNGVGELGFVRDKMVLAVGEKEIEKLKERYEEFLPLYPYLELWDEAFLAMHEPKLLEGRKEPIMAIGARGQITTVDYKKLSESFAQHALDTDKNIQLHYNEEVTMLVKNNDGTFRIYTKNSNFKAKTVVVNAGAYSLLFAQAMEYGKEYAILPIGGSFFFTKEKLLDSKVYTMQNPKLPFAAIHADPDCTQKWNTRFGPNAFALPKLERYHSLHVKDLLSALHLGKAVSKVYINLFKDKTIRRYIFKNFLEEIPMMGKNIFIKDARKIIPSLHIDDIAFAEGYGGMRPQIIDKIKKELLLGEAKIEEDGIIFNMTPSPGATTSLAIALKDARVVCKHLGVDFDEEKYKNEIAEPVTPKKTV